MGRQLVGEADFCGQLSLPADLAAILRRVVAPRDAALMNRRSLAESICNNETTDTPPIQFKTLLNKVHRLKRFVYHSVRMSEQGDKARIIAEVVPRANSRPRYSGCGKPRPGYDRMPQPREFDFTPIWNIPVSLS